MINYSCECCNFKTNLKSNFKRHLNTSKHLRVSQNVSKCIQMYPNDPKMYPNVSKIFKCKYCDKVFKYSQGLSKHLKYSCKKNNDESMKELVRLLNEQKEENKNMQKQINQLTKKLQIYKLNNTTNNNNNNNNTTNNNTTNNQICYNIQNNIQLLNHNNTDYSHLTDKDYLKCINDVNHCVKTLICKVHFNPNKPENHNIYISNLKSKNIMVYMDGKWKIEDRVEHVTDLYDDNHFVLEEWYAQYKNKYPEIVKSFERYLKNKDDEDIIKNIKELITKMLYNERDIVEKTKILLEKNNKN